MKYINNYIEEKLILNKDTKIKDTKEYWFTDDFGISLPFELELTGRPNNICIKIYNIKKIHQKDNNYNDVWGLYDELGRHVINIDHISNNVSSLNDLLKNSRHISLVNIIDKDISKKLKKEFTVAKYCDSESKILLKK